MFQQILVRPEDRKYQLILWRNSNGEVNSTPWRSDYQQPLRCLKQLTDDEGHRFPRAPAVLQRDFYVDDALKEEVISIRQELTELLRSAGLNIREWACNDKDILQGLSEKDKNSYHLRY